MGAQKTLPKFGLYPESELDVGRREWGANKNSVQESKILVRKMESRSDVLTSFSRNDLPLKSLKFWLNTSPQTSKSQRNTKARQVSWHQDMTMDRRFVNTRQSSKESKKAALVAEGTMLNLASIIAQIKGKKKVESQHGTRRKGKVFHIRIVKKFSEHSEKSTRPFGHEEQAACFSYSFVTQMASRIGVQDLPLLCEQHQAFDGCAQNFKNYNVTSVTQQSVATFFAPF